MREEYDFGGKKGVRGKYYERMRDGFTTIVRKTDGSTEIKETRPVFLDEDVQKYFPDSVSVNETLRRLIALVPEKNVK